AMGPRASRGEELPHLVDGQVEPLVAVVLAIARVPGVALRGAPHLSGGLGVPTEGDRSALGAKGRVRAGQRTRAGVENSVRVDGKEPDPELLEHRLDSGRVPAFRKPHPFRSAAEVPLELAYGGPDLRPPRRGAETHERQVSVGRAGGGPPDLPRLEEGADGGDAVAAVSGLELLDAMRAKL